MSTKNSSRFTPVIIAVSVVVGILIGTFYAKHFAGKMLGIKCTDKNPDYHADCYDDRCKT